MLLVKNLAEIALKWIKIKVKSAISAMCMIQQDNNSYNTDQENKPML
jgi:hypothetical protein